MQLYNRERYQLISTPMAVDIGPHIGLAVLDTIEALCAEVTHLRKLVAEHEAETIAWRTDNQ